MGQRDPISEACRIQPLPCEQLIVEALEIRHIRLAVEQMRDFIERVDAPGTLQIQDDARRIEQ